jgi:2-phosphosulfolactate phosphatase
MDANQNRHIIEVCFSPAVYPRFNNQEAVVVVVDILRATSAICTAFMNGARQIIPVATIEEARLYKEKGCLVAAERDGFVLDFADFGNSPFNFTKERVSGKTIIYSTTNGTKSVQMAKSCHKVLIGAFLNIDAVAHLLTEINRNVVIFCAGWKDKFNLEDTLFAGALTQRLLQTGYFYTNCDSAYASLDLWSLASPNVNRYIEKAAQRHRLKKNGLDDVLDFCFSTGLTNIVPVLEGHSLEACLVPSCSSSAFSSAGSPA